MPVASAREPRRIIIHALLLFLISALVCVGLTPVAQAVNTPVKECKGPSNSTTAAVGDTVTCTVDITTAASPSDILTGTVVVVSTSGGNYTSLAISTSPAPPTCTSTGSSCTVTLNTTSLRVDCDPIATCRVSTIHFTETLVVISATPDTISNTITLFPPGTAPIRFDAVPGPPVRIVAGGPPGKEFFATPNGGSTTSQCPREVPCTLDRAILLARDADTVTLLPGTTGVYAITHTFVINKLITIQPDGSNKVILKSINGVVIFDVTAQGGPNLHVTIRNFTMGGCTPTPATPTPVPTATPTPTPVCTTSISAQAAIRLIDDNYTEIAGNIIGAEDLPISNGIILSNSDHPNIHDNTIQGNSRFVFTPVLIVGQNQTGFGIVTLECFGGTPAGVSDSVTIHSNLFTNQWLAGIWMCSDGAGEHSIDNNTFRNNWRGVALKDVTNSTVSNNTLTDEKSDGIILYGASLRNTVNANRVESHIAASAVGIRIGWIADPIVPLSNNVTNNQLIRDTIGIHVFGARTTVIQGNQIKLSGARTAILVTPSTALGDPGTQPRDTEITGGNVIVFIGGCSPVIGCGLRLVGVTVPVLATDNDWGLRRPADVEGVIWHGVDDPTLGLVTFMPFRNMVVEVTATPGAGTTGTGAPGAMPGAPTSGAATPAAGASGPMPGAPSSGSAAALTTTVSLDAGCNDVNWPGANDYNVDLAAMGIVPAAAQRSATIWRKNNGDWVGWSANQDLPTRVADVFPLRRGDPLLVCVSQPATWLIPTQVGGP